MFIAIANEGTVGISIALSIMPSADCYTIRANTKLQSVQRWQALPYKVLKRRQLSKRISS